jgi:hypothetical protein
MPIVRLVQAEVAAREYMGKRLSRSSGELVKYAHLWQAALAIAEANPVSAAGWRRLDDALPLETARSEPDAAFWEATTQLEHLLCGVKRLGLRPAHRRGRCAAEPIAARYSLRSAFLRL